jgi:hypothetical protein
MKQSWPGADAIMESRFMTQKSTRMYRCIFSRWKGFCLVLAALWLQAVVVICIVLEINRVHTPVSEWLKRTINLLGM